MPKIINKESLTFDKSVIFHANTGANIGLGHFMRCKSIAFQFIKYGYNAIFIGKDLAEQKNDENEHFSIINLKNTDVNSFCKLLTNINFNKYNPEFIFIDSYDYNYKDFLYLKNFIKNSSKQAVTVALDDLAKRKIPLHSVINPTPLVSPKNYLNQNIPLVMCGEKYTIIRPEIVKLKKRKYIKNGHILITLGGGDVSNLILKILKKLPYNTSNEIYISVSKSCPINKFKQWLSKKPKKHFLNTDLNKFPKLLANASFVITGGGTTLWESYCLGVPSIAVIWAHNQVNTLNLIRQKQTSFYIDLISGDKYKNEYGMGIINLNEINESFYYNILHTLLTNEKYNFKIRKIQRNLIDGLGVNRIYNKLMTFKDNHKLL